MVAMNRTEALAHFEQNYVQAKADEKILQAEAHLLQHRDQLAGEFRESIKAIALKIKTMQAAGSLAKVRFVNYAMLRSALLANEPPYRIDVYNKEWYFDPRQPECSVQYDRSGIMRFLDQLAVELEEPRKLYFNQVTTVDLEQIKLREAAKYNQLIINLADYALHQEDTFQELAEIAKEDEFEIRVGEYYDHTEVVYKEDRREKNPETIKEWLEDKNENQYVAAVLKDLDLSGGDYPELDLRRVDFSGGNLSGSNLENCLLIKARLNDCNLNHINFSGSAIHDADFHGADLQQAAFYTAQGAKGMAQTMVDRIYSVWGVNFRDTNLQGADFRYANLQGADFRGAQLNGVDFYGTKLDKAIFNRVALTELSLSETQVAVIHWVD
jgi:uncharacterized protein YjbI with pentapeptide repeats